MTETISQQTALRRIVDHGIESVLVPAKFERAGKRTWIRHETELFHLIALGFRYGTYAIEFGIVSPEATDFVWGHPAKRADFGDVVMHGTPSDIRRPAACERFELGEQDEPAKIDEIARLVAQDIGAVATWLGQFKTRRQYRDYLLENRDPNSWNRFIIPSPVLKLYIAAVLAVLDLDPAAVVLADEAEVALRPWKDRLNAERRRRLRAAIAAMNEAGAVDA